MKRVTLTHLLHHTREMSHARRHMHTRTSIYMCGKETHTHTRAHTHTHTHTKTHAHTHTHKCTHTCTYTLFLSHTPTHTHTHTRTHTHTHSLTHTRTHTHNHTHIHAHTHTLSHTHTHTTLMGPAWAQMLVEAGGKDLLMLTNNDGHSCLHVAAQQGHDGVAQVESGVCRHRKEGVSRQRGQKGCACRA